jgi:hypothetical protein
VCEIEYGGWTHYGLFSRKPWIVEFGWLASAASTDTISNDMRNFRKRIRGFRRVYGKLVIRPVAGGSREDQARHRWRHHNRWFSFVVAVK